jgi:hypothetical protein
MHQFIDRLINSISKINDQCSFPKEEILYEGNRSIQLIVKLENYCLLPLVVFYLYRSMSQFNWNDSLNLFSKLTFRRSWNGLKVLSSYYFSKWFKKPVQWGLPVSISFEPTTSCNLRCPECPSG